MVPALWDIEVHGGIALVTNDAVVTAPRFGDGNWRGGWWAKYDRQTGDCIWRRNHRRGAELFDVIEDVIVSTTHKYSGIYALSLSSGRRLWTRLGDRFNLLLRFFDQLPCDNEGDAPVGVWHGQLLTRSGRLLDTHSGRVVSRHRLDYSTGDSRTLVRVDGQSVDTRGPLRERTSFQLHGSDTKQIELLLAKNKLELANVEPCVTSAHGITIAVACEPPQESSQSTQSRLYAGGSSRDVPHFLIMCDGKGTMIHERFHLGYFYIGEIDWADPCVFSVTTQTNRQWKWSYKRHLWLFEWSHIKEMLTNK